MKNIKISRDIVPFIFLTILSIMLLIFVAINDKQILVMDEVFHYKQIDMFYQNNFSLVEKLTVIPGYHFLLALICKLFNNCSLQLVRFINIIFAFLSYLIFYFTARQRKEETAIYKLLLFVFLPILFPYAFFVYTDTMSLLFILLAFYFAQNKKYRLSGFIGMLSLLIRQNNIFWVFFIAIYIYNKKYKNKTINYKEMIKDYMYFILSFILLFIFIIINQGLVVGDKSHHPFKISFTNLYFFLFTVFCLFLPYQYYNLLSIIKKLKNNKKILYYIIAFFIFLPCFFYTLTITHIYNYFYCYIHNLIVLALTANVYRIFILLAIVLLAFYYLMELKFLEKNILYIISFIHLISLWLIEQRYYIIPFTFLLLLKNEPIKRSVYYFITLFIYISLSLYFIFVVNFSLFAL